jgi:hypothetical protein
MIRNGNMSEIGRMYIESRRKHLNDRDFHDSVFSDLDSLSPQRKREIQNNLSKSIKSEKERERLKNLPIERRKKVNKIKDKLNKTYNKEERKTKIKNNTFLVFIKSIWYYYFNKINENNLEN